MDIHVSENTHRFLAVDIGNTHTVIGLFAGQQLTTSWRIHTEKEITADELFALLRPLLQVQHVGLDELDSILISSVVPPVTEAWAEMSKRYSSSLIVDAHEIAMKLVQIEYPRPHEVGTDRLLNSLAAFKKFKKACIVIDYGTATTFDCISDKGQYLGGAIAPGILLAAKSLFTGTSKLPMVRFPRNPIDPLGKNTERAIQAGLLYGFAGLTDNIVSNLMPYFNTTPIVIATGGLSSVLLRYCSKIDQLEPHLTMEGLRHCHDYLQSLKTR